MQGIFLKSQYKNIQLWYFFPATKNKTRKYATLAVNHFFEFTNLVTSNIDIQSKDELNRAYEYTINSFFNRMEYCNIEKDTHYNTYHAGNGCGVLREGDYLFTFNGITFDEEVIVENKEPKKNFFSSVLTEDKISMFTEHTQFINILRIPQINITSLFDILKEITNVAKVKKIKLYYKQQTTEKLKEIEGLYDVAYNKYVNDFNIIKKNFESLVKQGYFYKYNEIKAANTHIFNEESLKTVEDVKGIEYKLNKHLKQLNAIEYGCCIKYYLN